MPRNREFNDIRLTTSRKTNLSPALALSRSQVLTKLDGDANNSKVTLSPIRNFEREKSVPLKKICTHCINNELRKHNHKKSALHHEKEATGLDLSNVERRDIIQKEKQKVDDFNRKKAEIDRARKEASEKEKQVINQLLENAHEVYEKSVETQKQVLQERRHRLKQELEAQIDLAKAKKNESIKELKETPMNAILQQHYDPSLKENYKKAIREQIEEQKLKVKERIQSKVACGNLPVFSEEAAQKEANRKREAETKKHELLNSQKQADTEIEIRRATLKNAKLKELEMRIAAEREERETNNRLSFERQQQIKNYVEQLKMQMEANKYKRANELLDFKAQANLCLLPENTQSHKEECHNCHKSYPTTILEPFANYS